ncbi:RagB/SusD family nutrient uptake outer membrane protein [Rufibacter roseus]|uniref:RagB/SusD family nutrient uptake outer membrane protein n=1 Tax=Rufibacter roseus TaxID=1567108 RepID=A0ABW2DSH9_9BACT|nr:RagB/SusD family nutrient uptake outer membrane protein [Rufibacter roseus]
MTSNIIKKMVVAGGIALSMTACTDDLNLAPQYEVTSASLYKDFANYKSVLAKIYGGYALTGLKTDGAPDLSGFDEGKSNYIRAYWTLQELSTDEAVIAWSDVFPIHNMNWNSGTEAVRMMYDRIFYQVALTNEFIRNTTDARLAENGITGANLEEARNYRAEARFLRAMTYWHALDLYGNVPFVTETDPIGFFNPPQISRAELFAWVESELLAVEAELVPARQNEYPRADKAAAWMVLAKLYLNAEVYTGQARYTDAITYSKKVIDAGYTLAPEYPELFMADNDRYARTTGGVPQEIILPVAFDGRRTTSWGGTTFLIHASLGPEHNAAAFGMNGGWGGLRATPEVIDLFNTSDERAIYHTEGHTKEIEAISNFANGYPLNKYTNITSTGAPGSDPGLNFPDTDFPLFRLADAYLMYAEAVLRGGTGGDRATALGYVNMLRNRAFNGAGSISDAQLTLNFILNERARELHWEGHRRTDLIRYGLFTSSNYLWAWKGGVPAGRGVADYRRLYPIPASDLAANPNLKQNTGY